MARKPLKRLRPAHRLVRARRKALGLSQAELARRARLSREMVSRFESGSEIGLGAFERLLAALELRLELAPAAANELRVSDWRAFREGLDAQLLARARMAHSARDNLASARLIDGARVRVIDWGKIPA
jgi:transcriptional regulator with XRE-family HTH domain